MAAQAGVAGAAGDAHPAVSVIVPAHDEERVIDSCLAALLTSAQLLRRPDGTSDTEVVVVANGCSDATVAHACAWTEEFSRAGIRLTVVDRPEGGKAGALNHGDRAARGAARVYLDADVVVAPEILPQLAAALDAERPVYASGTLRLAPTRSWVSSRYGAVWAALPRVSRHVPGYGLYAVNATGRRRWTDFPAIHSDDKFVRSRFAAAERVQVPAAYLWPLPEGLRNLVRVRSRWCEGNREFERHYGGAGTEPRNSPAAYLGLALRRPVSAVVFTLVYALGWAQARLRPAGQVTWRRGR